MNQPNHPPYGAPQPAQEPTAYPGQPQAYPSGYPQQNQPPNWQSTGNYHPGYGGASYPIAMAPRPFSARGRAVATVYGLGVVILLNLLSIPLTLWENALVRQYGISPASAGSEAPSEAIGWLMATAGLGFFTVAAAITTAVFFLMWMHRAYRMLEINGLPGLKSSSGWAVGWWFIPIANLGMPYQVVKEIFERSEHGRSTGGFAYGAQKESSWIVGAWWLVWVVSLFATNASVFMASFAKSPEQYIRGNWVSIGATVLYAMAGVLAIMVVRDIDNRQWRAFCSGQRPTVPQSSPVQVG